MSAPCGCQEAWAVVKQNDIVMDGGEFTVVEATDSDTDALLRLRDDAARWLLSRGIDQWQLGEIPYSWERGDDYFVFVLWHGQDRVGTVTILWDDPVIWGEQPVPAGYVHNLIVARPFGGQGLGLRLLQWAENYVTESGRSLARLDCGSRSRGCATCTNQWAIDGCGTSDTPGCNPTWRSRSTRRNYRTMVLLEFRRRRVQPRGKGLR